MSKKLKTVLISVVSVVVAVAIVIGIVWALGRNSDPVKVVPVSMHSSKYMGNETESTGFVTAEQLQKIGSTDDFHISPYRDDGTTPGTPTWIWSVVVDGDGRAVGCRVGIQVPHGHAACDDETVVRWYVPRYEPGHERLVRFS